MKVYRQTTPGIDGLQLCDMPDPAAPVGRQVLMHVRASSLNFRDLLSLKLGVPSQYVVGTGHFPMCDGSGEVVAVGADVTRVKPGDRVAATFHWDWIGGPIPPPSTPMAAAPRAMTACSRS